ncbi:hypothetical protein CMEL01_10590 [Colletotrichum melonis]|uniref:Uncharacterized protein n=1 Tax=Colletotrichum melonis TaxID=1209925 RepID=A0AAI9XEU5_9PEZI|nr:hypothetical protein CMEL01_10590 [Colletotrichum melonis]
MFLSKIASLFFKNISVPGNETTESQTIVMAPSDFNTQVLADQPSKMIQECDEVFKSIVKYPGEIPYHLAGIIVDHLWVHFRNWLDRHLKTNCDRPEPLSGLRAIDERISMGGEREKTNFVHDLKVLYHYLEKMASILLRGAENRLRGDEATRKDPLPLGSPIEIDYDIRLGPRSDLGWYMFFGIPMRFLLLESASFVFSEKDDEAADAYLAETVSKGAIEGGLINQHIH